VQYVLYNKTMVFVVTWRFTSSYLQRLVQNVVQMKVAVLHSKVKMSETMIQVRE